MSIPAASAGVLHAALPWGLMEWRSVVMRNVGDSLFMPRICHMAARQPLGRSGLPASRVGSRMLRMWNGYGILRCAERPLEGGVVSFRAVGNERPGDPARRVPGLPQHHPCRFWCPPRARLSFLHSGRPSPIHSTPALGCDLTWPDLHHLPHSDTARRYPRREGARQYPVPCGGEPPCDRRICGGGITQGPPADVGRTMAGPAHHPAASLRRHDVWRGPPRRVYGGYLRRRGPGSHPRRGGGGSAAAYGTYTAARRTGMNRARRAPAPRRTCAGTCWRQTAPWRTARPPIRCLTIPYTMWDSRRRPTSLGRTGRRPHPGGRGPAVPPSQVLISTSSYITTTAVRWDLSGRLGGQLGGFGPRNTNSGVWWRHPTAPRPAGVALDHCPARRENRAISDP